VQPLATAALGESEVTPGHRTHAREGPRHDGADGVLRDSSVAWQRCAHSLRWFMSGP
jgi:hypothetical protein